jgi:hypothetical protein
MLPDELEWPLLPHPGDDLQSFVELSGPHPGIRRVPESGVLRVRRETEPYTEDDATSGQTIQCHRLPGHHPGSVSGEGDHHRPESLALWEQYTDEFVAEMEAGG